MNLLLRAETWGEIRVEVMYLVVSPCTWVGHSGALVVRVTF